MVFSLVKMKSEFTTAQPDRHARLGLVQP
jgi:hypothetical protein